MIILIEPNSISLKIKSTLREYILWCKCFQGTQINIDLFSLGNDPEHWKDPDEFIPERFLNDEGKYTKSPILRPFGLGIVDKLKLGLEQLKAFIVIPNYGLPSSSIASNKMAPYQIHTRTSFFCSYKVLIFCVQIDSSAEDTWLRVGSYYFWCLLYTHIRWPALLSATARLLLFLRCQWWYFLKVK